MAFRFGRREALGWASALFADGGREALAASGVSLRPAEGGARLILPLPAGTRWTVSAATDPMRLRVHLPAGWPAGGGGPGRMAGAGPVRRVTWNNRARVLVLELEAPVTAPAVLHRDGALVVLVRSGSSPNFLRLARAGVLAEGGGSEAAGTAPLRPAVSRAPAVATARTVPASLPLVVLDPGHGGKDPGAIGASGTHEKRIVLAAAHELKRRLEATGACRVAMTRTRDVFVPLAKRVEFARARDAALFMSIHADSAPGARGASVYTLSDTASDALSAGLAKRENAADAAGGLRIPAVPPEVARILMSLVRQETRQGSSHMAGLVVSSLRGDVALLPNTHREAAFAVLKAPDVPSVLVEMGFLSDRADEAALRRPEHRAKVADALAEAATSFLQRRGA